MADVFISYKTESSLELVEHTIVPAIEAAGFKCWYAKRDSRHGLYAGNIKRAIGNCHIFLLVLDKAALHAQHIKSETALAFRRLSEGEQITLIPFSVDGTKVREDDDLDFFLNCLQSIDGNPPDEKHIHDLINTISAILTF